MTAALLPLLVALAAPQTELGFDRLFTGRTLRFDYFHGGTAQSEQISLGGLRLEGEWPGSRVLLLDDTGLGKYRFRVEDPETGETLYSRGFSSIYGEWETTGEAATERRTFHESMRFPEPRGKVRLVIDKRDGAGRFMPIYQTDADPASRTVDRSPIARTGTVRTVFENGPPAGKVDLLILGDGYTQAELGKFDADVDRLTQALFAVEPFAHLRSAFNVRALAVVAESSGVSDPSAGVWRRTPLGLTYDAFGSERYMLTFSDEAVREAAAQAPYDALMLLANSRKYGGGGIFNLWTTTAVDSKHAAHVVVHEFGHSFAGLGDEYYTSQVAYETFNPPGTEPWEPNVTALSDPSALKWKELVEEGTPIPTPWNQDAYDRLMLDFEARRSALRQRRAPEEEMETLFAEVAAATGPLLRGERYSGKVGAFTGASYQAKGLYRPAVDCVMFSRNAKGFCPVCSQAIERVVRLHTGVSDHHSGAVHGHSAHVVLESY